MTSLRPYLRFQPLTRLLAFALALLPLALPAQRDSIPHIVTGKFDWRKYKQEVKAPIFQQNDLAVYILRKDSLTPMLAQEESAAWIQDFHFIDINGDRMLDAIYSGQTKAKGGYYTYFMLADSGMQYPICMEAPGYVHQLVPSETGVEFIIRSDAHGKEYLHTVSEYFFSYKTRKLSLGWQLQMLSTTEVPIMRQPERFLLKYPTELRTTPRVMNEPPMDHNQDGKSDATGNVQSPLDAGQPLLRVAESDADGQRWSFVIMLSTPTQHRLFKPIKGSSMAYAGWIPTEALGIK